MKQTTGKPKHVAVRTVWLSVVSSVIVGLSSLVLGLSIYGNSLIQESISKARSTVSKAASSAKHGVDSAGLAKEVMRIYNTLNIVELTQTGTETYRQYFDSIQTGKNQKNSNLLYNILRNFTGDISRLYVCAFDAEQELIAHENQIIKLLESLVESLSLAIDERSHYTGNHTQNMVNMADAFMNWLEEHGNPWEYDETRRRVFMMSVGLHDIGKDRPYKKPLPLDKALAILDDMVKEGSLDGDLLALFKESHAWEAEVKDS